MDSPCGTMDCPCGSSPCGTRVLVEQDVEHVLVRRVEGRNNGLSSWNNVEQVLVDQVLVEHASLWNKSWNTSLLDVQAVEFKSTRRQK